MPDPEPQGGPPPAATPGPRRPAGCLRACTVLVGLGFIASMVLLVVLWTCSDLIVGQVVQAQVDAFQRALEQADLPSEERKRGKEIAEELGKAITDGKIKRDDNLDEWPRVEQILTDFRSDTDGGEKILSPVQARTYIDRMDEVLKDLERRSGGGPQKPQ